MALILIIDDEDQVASVLKKVLERNGYATMHSPNGKLAKAIYDENPPDLVITDIFMPEMDGIEVIQDIRKRYSGVKIIAISGGGVSHHTDILEVARILGAARLFNKPFDISEIVEAVKELLPLPGN